MLVSSIRAKALLLLALFLSAGTSLPSLDALAFHHDGSGERSRTHVEPAGGCLSHADHCSLGRGATGTGSALTISRELRLPHAVTVQIHSPPVDPGSAVILGIPQPRAPPVRFA